MSKGMNMEKSVKRTKRVGRGPASGKGKTSGRGMNGQRSRTGAKTSQIEGGQTKLIMRLPKAGGFKSLKKDSVFSVTTDKVNKIFKEGGEVKKEDIIKSFNLSIQKIRRVKVIRGSENLLNSIKLTSDIDRSKSIEKISPEKSEEKQKTK